MKKAAIALLFTLTLAFAGCGDKEESTNTTKGKDLLQTVY